MEGLIIIPNYISEDKEKELMSFIDIRPKTEATARNSIRRYGKSYFQDCDFNEEIPEIFKQFNDFEFTSVSINEYHPGQGIGYHVDQGGEIVNIISLLSDATMLFRHLDTNRIESIQIPRRGLVQLTGKSRYEWEHSIPPVKELRYSIAFRTEKNKGT